MIFLSRESYCVLNNLSNLIGILFNYAHTGYSLTIDECRGPDLDGSGISAGSRCSLCTFVYTDDITFEMYYLSTMHQIFTRLAAVSLALAYFYFHQSISSLFMWAREFIVTTTNYEFFLYTAQRKFKSFCPFRLSFKKVSWKASQERCSGQLCSSVKIYSIKMDTLYF